MLHNIEKRKTGCIGVYKNITKDLTGETFDKWLVLGKSTTKGGYYTCKCHSCGLVKDMSASTMWRGKSRGCYAAKSLR